MNLSPTWVGFFREQGIDSVHWIDLGDVRAADVEIMNRARADDLVVLSCDLDFSVLVALTRGTGPSVVQLRSQDTLPDAIGATVCQVLRDHEAALSQGAIVTVDRAGSRVRILGRGLSANVGWMRLPHVARSLGDAHLC